ncbi:hypothetical protein [Mucilaginibacter flavidus]|uniref:hypothetical protein n=1 Tax=Mucilaginibacter flavidus TaxID=2949309 RepID=UPI002093DEA1|nr:hypothetical protein [Mucilaginibacter flavidus]MCO5946575.1 hypothetical protein [Mucilaginibacter flavidus]
MSKIKIFLGSQLLEELFVSNKLDAFFMKFEEFHFTLLQHKNGLQAEIFMDISELLQYQELDLYGLKSVISNFTDGASYCLQVDTIPSKDDYYKVTQVDSEPFKKISCLATIEAFEKQVLESGSIRLISRTEHSQSIIKIHKYVNKNPILSSIAAVLVDFLFLEVFFEHYLKNEITDTQEYSNFHTEYLKFYKKFDWSTWVPSLDPAPAHKVIQCLKKYHTTNKEDTYLLKWGHIMAVLNGAKFNKGLTTFNKKKEQVNDVFQAGISKANNTIFFSVDTENGLLEVYDYRGVHLNNVYGLERGIVTQKRNYTIDVPVSKWLKD